MKIQGLWPVRVHTSWPRKAVGNGEKKSGCNVERARRRDADGGNDYEEFKTTLAEMNEKIMMQFCIRRKNYLQELK